MIKSMTGFGRCEVTRNNRTVSVEMKSVNHRYLDLTIKSPKAFSPYEQNIRQTVRNRISRGKVDLYVSYTESCDSLYQISYNPSIAAAYVENIAKMAEEFGLENDLKVSRLASFPDVFTIEEAEEDQDELVSMLNEALNGAIDEFIANRTNEGQRLREDLLAKLDEMSGYVTLLEDRSPNIVAEYKTRLTEKIADLLGDEHVDENRIAMEVTMYADKICIDEEMVRLRSHVEEARAAMDMEEVGRKLDFVAQEMNREANTILSKSTDVEIANIGISLKTLIEKIREQIQNIE